MTAGSLYLATPGSFEQARQGRESGGVGAVPLCVDLDGTLTASDMLWECIAVILRTRPWLALLFPWWLLRGRAYLKSRLAEHGMVDPELLPYNRAVLEWLRQERAAGRQLVLASASHEAVVARIAQHLCLSMSGWAAMPRPT